MRARSLNRLKFQTNPEKRGQVEPWPAAGPWSASALCLKFSSCLLPGQFFGEWRFGYSSSFGV